MQDSNITAILLMAGIGSRFQSSLPKQYHNLSGKKVYFHTLDIFLKSNLFQEIILVCDEKFTKMVAHEVQSFTHCKVISGGKTRQESSYLALLACPKNTDYVVIHDGVRPFVSRRILEENCQKVLQYKAVDTCIKSADTIVHSKNNAHINAIPPRSEYLRGQTPQSFSHSLIKQAHEKAIANAIKDASDDCQLVHRLGHEIAIVEGEEKNIKITTNLDLFLAEQIFRLPNKNISSSKTSLTGKTFIVVGSTGGIGKEICRQLEESLAKVIPLSRHSTEITLDLSDMASIEKAFQEVFLKYGEVDGLINAAGILVKKPLDIISLKEIKQTLQVNLTGVILSCKHAKLKPQGHIINIASSSYFKGRKDYGIYSSTKAALVNFSQSLAEEKKDLSVNIVVPQRTDTKMRRDHFNDDNKDLLPPQEVARKIISVLQSENLSGDIIEIRAQN
ncbi:MAG: 2-C-methyl-D-erythritol 4-phosphate cytidylyltransferase [Chlamydiota bacterium]|jgi:2-C-methyl-D-erythritol 4-phosphate cytidylyltransferase